MTPSTAVQSTYYGRIQTPEHQKTMLESLGIECGRYRESTGTFAVRVPVEVKKTLDSFEADFPAQLWLRDDDGEEVRPVKALSQEQLQAEIAYTQFMADAVRMGGRDPNYWAWVESVVRQYLQPDGAKAPPSRADGSPHLALLSLKAGRVLDLLQDDGTSPASQQTFERWRSEFDDTQLLRLEEALSALDALSIDKVAKEISQGEFRAALGAVPPLDSVRRGKEHTFKSSEFYSGDVTRTYAAIDGRYFTFRDRSSLTHEQIVAKARGVQKPGLEAATVSQSIDL